MSDAPKQQPEPSNLTVPHEPEPLSPSKGPAEDQSAEHLSAKPHSDGDPTSLEEIYLQGIQAARENGDSKLVDALTQDYHMLSPPDVAAAEAAEPDAELTPHHTTPAESHSAAARSAEPAAEPTAAAGPIAADPERDRERLDSLCADGVSAQRSGDNETARRTFERVLALNSDHVQALIRYGLLMDSEQQYSRAAELLHHASSLVSPLQDHAKRAYNAVQSKTKARAVRARRGAARLEKSLNRNAVQPDTVEQDENARLEKSLQRYPQDRQNNSLTQRRQVWALQQQQERERSAPLAKARAKEDKKRGRCGTHHGTRVWVVFDLCGIACVAATYALIGFAVLTVNLLVLPAYADRSCSGCVQLWIFNIVAALSFFTHLRGMLSDPGTAPRDALNVSEKELMAAVKKAQQAESQAQKEVDEVRAALARSAGDEAEVLGERLKALSEAAHKAAVAATAATTKQEASNKFCGYCEAFKPQRAHHCRTCERCVTCIMMAG